MAKIRSYIGFGLGILAVAAIFYYFSDIISWLVIAWIISLLGSPIMDLLGRLRIGKFRLPAAARALITLSVFLTALALFVALFVPVIVQQGRNLASVDYQELLESLEDPINHSFEQLEEWGLVAENDFFVEDSTQLVPQKQLPVPIVSVDSMVQKLSDSLGGPNIELHITVQGEGLKAPIVGADTVVTAAPSSRLLQLEQQALQYINPASLLKTTFSTMLAWLGNLFVLITSVSFIAFFFLQEEGLFANLIKGPFPEKYDAQLDKTLQLTKKMLIRYFEGILGQVTAVSVYVWLLLWIVGAPNAFLIAFFAAIINVVPYLGPFLGLIFGLLVCICSSLNADFYAETVPLLIKVALVFASMQALDNMLLQPLIFSKSVKAHPLEIFLVIIVGSKLGGIMGMVIAIPAYTVIRVIASIFLSEFRLVQGLTQQLGIRNTWGGEQDVERPEEDDRERHDDSMDADWH
ncbi:AI-2E family transporter [Saprospira sp. CCB-QB6]|uniref:AI-2E family transporter n=1 Tax=Saprospira sp. CCB-QB6 TaxID=3023936 RepID=UPI00234BF317|nr:AI-2E family transporter [Saprospira sp. CCB-QB6]WCL80236.1 AI-2E family transporter [Saprospira sp. CCB-QB6]